MPQYELEGQIYHLNNGNWYGEDHIQVPTVIADQLIRKYGIPRKNNRKTTRRSYGSTRNTCWIRILPGCVGAGKRR